MRARAQEATVRLSENTACKDEQNKSGKLVTVP
jgi:hypothetical protein